MGFTYNAIIYNLIILSSIYKHLHAYLMYDEHVTFDANEFWISSHPITVGELFVSVQQYRCSIAFILSKHFNFEVTKV